MIELFSADTPNGKKISIMLEEINLKYKVTKIDLSKGEQFNINFRKISPLSKIPTIIDHKNKVNLFQSGAILIYLAELSGKFYDTENRNLINQWLMAQIVDIGPMLGQHHKFNPHSAIGPNFIIKPKKPRIKSVLISSVFPSSFFIIIELILSLPSID